MPIDDAEQLLRQFEFSIQDLTRKYEGKQSQRLFASPVWVIDHLEGKIKNQLSPLVRELENLKNTSENATIQNNATISIQHVQEISCSIGSIINSYKDNTALGQIEQIWGQHLPAINEKLKSLRHRISIIKGTFGVKHRIQDEDWYNNL